MNFKIGLASPEIDLTDTPRFINLKNQSDFTVNGTCNSEGSPISFSVETQQVGDTICDGKRFKADLDFQPIIDGDVTITVTIERNPGEIVSSKATLPKDTIAPSLSNLTGENNNKVNLSNQNSYTVSGSCDDSTATVSFLYESNELATTDCDGTAFSADLNMESLDSGDVTLDVVITDPLDNSEETNIALSKDITTPLLSDISGENDNKVNFNNQASYTISGSCDDNSASISIYFESQNLWDGSCTGGALQGNVNLQSFSDGLIVLFLEIQDESGNLSVESLFLNKDTVIPTLSNIIGDNDNKINENNQNAYTISGSCDDNSATVSFSSSLQNLGSTVCTNSSFTKDFDFQDFSDSLFVVSVTIEDSFGNTSSQDLNLEKDTVPPVVSLISGENDNKINFDNQGSYSISGNCDDSEASIFFSMGSESLGNTACNGSSFQAHLDFQDSSDGPLTLSIRIVDEVGNSNSASLLLRKDTVAPTLSSLRGETNNKVNLNNQDSYTVSGSCNDNTAVVSFSVNSNSLGETACSGSDFTRDLDLQSFSDGDLAVSLTITDEFGNASSQDLALEKDATAPILSNIIGENSNKVNFSNQGGYTLSGACDTEDAAISFSSNSQDLGSAVCDGTGFTKDVDLQSFSDGALLVSLTIQDSFENTSSQDLNLEKDVVFPILSGVAGENNNKVNLANQAAYTLSGDCDTEDASISFSSGSENLGSVVCRGLSFTKDVDLQSFSDGALTVSLTIEDSFGNANSQALALEKDATAPRLSSLIGEYNNKVNLANQAAYTISGACDTEDASISFSSGSENLGSAVCNGTSFTKDVDLQSFSDGALLVSLTIQDSFDNTSSQDLALEKDATAPRLSSLIGENNNKVNLANQAGYTVSGDCDTENAVISFSSNSQSLGFVVCNGTGFTKDVDLQLFSDGALVISITIEDDHGNTGSQNLNVTKDIIVPSLSSVLGENNNKVNFQNQSAYTVSGDCDTENANISFSSNSQNLGSASCGGASFAKDFDLQAFSQGPLIISISIVDDHGNFSSQDLNLTKDTMAPRLSNVSGENSNKVNFQNQSAYTVSGSCDAQDAIISFSANSQDLGSAICNGTSFTQDFDFQAFSEGAFLISLSAVDDHGNTSSLSFNLTKDTVAPILSNVLGENGNKVNFQNQASYTLSGNCDTEDAIISFSADSRTLGSLICDGTSFTNDLGLQAFSQGSLVISISIVDGHGNTSSQDLNLTKDTVAPSLSNVLGENNNKVNFQNQSAYMVSGGCDTQNAVISFSSNSQDLGSASCDGTSFTQDFDLQAFSEGALVISLSIVDDHGNTSSQDLNLTKDTVAPILSNVLGENDNKVNLQNQAAYTVSGTCDTEDAVLSFSSNSQSLGSASCSSTSFTKDLDLQAFSQGSLVISISVVDGHGNTNSQDLNLTKDTVAPTLSNVSGENSNKVNSQNQSAYTVSGDCDTQNAVISFSSNSQSLGSASCSGTSFTQDLDLQAFSQGPLVVSLTITDDHGNFSSQDLNLTKDTVAPTLSNVSGENGNKVNSQNQAAYTVSGTCDTEDISISFSANSQDLGSAVCDGSGFTKDVDLQTFSDGSLIVSLITTDDHGNTSSFNLSLTKDTVAPTLSNVSGENGNKVNLQNEDAYTISGDCDTEDASISFSSGSESLGSAVCDGTNFTKDVDLQSFSDGDLAISLVITDDHGNFSSLDLNLTKDTVAPTLSNVSGENGNKVNFQNQAAYTISGNCDTEDASISFSSSSQSLSSAICDGTSFTKDVDLQAFADGGLVVVLTITDALGNTSSLSLSLTKDTVAPRLSNVSGENGNKVNLSNQAAYTLSGECDTEDASLSFSSGSESLGSAVCDGTNFTKDVDLQAFADGDLVVLLTILDDHGNAGSLSLSLTKDTVAPTLSNVSGENGNKVNLSNQAAYTLSGECDTEDASLSFSSGSQSLGSAVCDGSGFTKDVDLQTFSEGALVVSLTITDDHGNFSSQDLNLTKDAVAPTLSNVSGENGNKVNLANQAAYTLSGECDTEDASISFSSGSESLGSAVCDGTNFTKDVDLQSFVDGGLVVVLTITDALGNYSSFNLSLTKDTVAPTLSNVSGENGNKVNFQNQAAYTLSGTCDTEDAVISFLANSQSLGSAICDGTNFTKDVDLQAFADGDLVVSLTITDDHGNFSSLDLNLTKDTVAPTLSNVSGENGNKVNFQNQAAYTISGNCDTEDASISFSSGSESLGSAICDGTNFTKDVDLQTFSESDLVVSLTITDDHGNFSSLDLNLTKDAVAPTLSNVSGENGNKVNFQNQAAYTISGNCDTEDASISFSSAFQSLDSAVCNGTSFTKDVDLQSFVDGGLVVVLTITDALGNFSSFNLSLTKDTVAPTLSNVSGENGNKVNFQNQAAYTISGECDTEDASISFSSGSESLGSAICDGTNFTKDVDLQAFADGDLVVLLAILDDHGNAGSLSLSLTKDTVAPTLSHVSGENNNKVNFQNQAAYTISGNCDTEDASVSFSSGSESLGSAVCDGTNFTKDVDLQAFADGDLVVSLAITDDHGNFSSLDLNLTKDTVAPTLSHVSGENNNKVNFQNQDAYTISGTCGTEDASIPSISFSSGSESLGSAICDGTNFIKDVDLQAFADGDLVISLAITDDHGNFSSFDLNLTKDTVAPTLSNVSGENSNKVNFQNQAAYTISGECDTEDASISFSSGSESLGSAICDGTNFTKDVDLQSFADGDLAVSLTITDDHGNFSSLSLSLTKDTVAPTLSHVSGENNNKVNFQNQAAYTISGTCDTEDASISFSSGSESLGSAVCNGTSFTKDVDLQSFADGDLVVSLAITDDHGNFSSLDLNLTKDTVAPTLSHVSGENGNKVNLANQAAYTISGTCDTEDASISFSSSSQPLGSAVCNGTGFTKDVDLQSFADGDLVVSLMITDDHGNFSSLSLSLTKDTVAPTLSHVSGENNNKVNFQNQAAYTISGTCDTEDAAISFSSGSESLGSAVCNGTSFTKDVDLQSFADGDLVVSLAITDDHGNFSSLDLNLTKDTVAPTLSNVSGENGNKVNFQNQAAYTISGTCDTEDDFYPLFLQVLNL